MYTSNTTNDNLRQSRIYFFKKLAQTILLRPITTTSTLAFRIIKLLIWAPAKTGFCKISGRSLDTGAYFEREYIKTIQVIRNLLFIPSTVKRLFKEMIAKHENFKDDLNNKTDYLKPGVRFSEGIEQFSSYVNNTSTHKIIIPEIQEFESVNDASLKAIMASDIFNDNIMAINFGLPNVATFVTTKDENDQVQTVKVDAKSFRRSTMQYHPTNGKIQSGIFFVPTNLPNEALERFKASAEQLANENLKDITCVKTNCRVLKSAGFSIEGINMDKIILPTTFMELLLSRNVFYTDLNGQKHKVRFDILKTSKYSFQEFFEQIDIAVVSTRLRHRRRNADTEENRQRREENAKIIINNERNRRSNTTSSPNAGNNHSSRVISVSVPSSLGNFFARLWGRHTIYEIDLKDHNGLIKRTFQNDKLLHTFPQERPSLSTRLKKNIFFSKRMIRFLRRQIINRRVNIQCSPLKLLQSVKGERFNYVLLENKAVFSFVHANNNNTRHRKIADWALSKHALLANRNPVYCSGEIWCDPTDENSFVINHDSGTYLPSPDQTHKVAELAKQLFGGNFRAESETQESETQEIA